MLKLYYMPGACSLATHIVLEWAKLPYESQKVPRDELKSPSYLKINPLGAVPALADDGWVLTQNSAILEYVAEQAPAAKLLGDGTAKSRAEVRRWLAFINSDVHKTFSLVFGAQRYLAQEAAQNELRASASAQLSKLFALLDAQLNGRTYLASETPSIADAYLYVVLRWAHGKEIDLKGQDHLAAFFKRMDADPAVQKALKAEE